MKSMAVTFFGVVVIAWILTARDEPIGPGRDGRSKQGTVDSDVEDPGAIYASHRTSFDEAIEFARKSSAALDDVKDYTAVFSKMERVRGRMTGQTMDLKFRREPFSVYLRRRSHGKRGREILYVAGANDGRVLVHEIGLEFFTGTLRLDPNDPKVMLQNRHPITEVGISKLAEAALSIWETEIREVAPENHEVRFFPFIMLGSTECAMVQTVHLRKQPGFDFQIYRVYFDRRTKFPIQEEQYGWPERPDEKPPLLERYHYHEIRTNIGLNEVDFDPRNPEYRFIDASLPEASSPSGSSDGAEPGFSP